MALKNTQIPITIKEYDKIMSNIINMDLPVHEKLTALLEEASKYTITRESSERSKMTLKERKNWIRELKPFWKDREKHLRLFRIAEEAIEFDIKACLKQELEFFYVDGECVGIGHQDWARRKKGKNHFPLIHDRELE